MAYSERLAQRIREHVSHLPGIAEKKMFGGVAFLLSGNLACGVSGDELIVRVGKDGFTDALNRGNARPFDMTGRPMAGWVLVSTKGTASDQALQTWIDLGVNFAQTLPPK